MTDVATDVRAIDWYHTIELPNGVLTPGRYDLRPVVRRLPIPASLRGRRCLDVGTADGFWAFEFERRGAEVVALDTDPEHLDWPVLGRPDTEAALRVALDRRTAFETAHRALDSSVEHRTMTAYDVSPDTLGEFDLVFVGSLLLHLRDPLRALAAIRSVTGGRLMVNEAISPALTALRPRTPAAEFHGLSDFRWWLVNAKGLARLVEASGFRVLASGRPYPVPYGPGAPPRRPLGTDTRWHAAGRRRLSTGALLHRAVRVFGVPHAWVLGEAEPLESAGRTSMRDDQVAPAPTPG
jgi:tRNA (mo5U34)-methyltransferase